MQKHVKMVTFRVPAATYDALEAIKVRDGIPFSEQLRRALQTWIDAKHVTPARTTRKARR